MYSQLKADLLAENADLKRRLEEARKDTERLRDQIAKLRDEQNRLTGNESKHDKAMLVGRVDGLQMAINTIDAARKVKP